MYLNQLAPWEQKKQYHEVIEIGHDLHTQTEVLKAASKKQLESQIMASNSIIASNEQVTKLLNSGFEDISIELQEISNGLYDLKASFEWGISEVVWQFEQNREILKDILKGLMAPLDTQAKELKQRAEEAYSNGWHDDALEDFLLSETKNRYDFSIHISIGMIYLFHIVDKTRALESFEKAIKYSRPKSNYHTSYSLLYKGLILFDMDRIAEAEECSQEAIELTSSFIEAYYQNAIHNAHLNNINKCLSNLRVAFYNTPQN